MIVDAVVSHEGTPDSLKPGLSILRREFFKIVVGAILKFGRRNQNNLAILRNAIEHDIFESKANCPVMGTHRLVSVPSSNLLKVLFEEQEYMSIMYSMNRTLKTMKIENFDEFLSPAAYSAFLAFIYGHIACALISNSQQKTELFLSKCFTPKHSEAMNDVDDERNVILSDAFFDGAVLSPDGDSKALKVVFDYSPYKPSMESLQKTVECKHNVIPCFARSHLFSPPVSHCGICGKCFLSDREINMLKKSKKNADWVINEMKKRRAKHFAEVFGTTEQNMFPSRGSSMTCFHNAVRLVCSQPKFQDLKEPTREVVVAVLENILKRPVNGCPYEPDILKHIVLCVSDFLKKRASNS